MSDRGDLQKKIRKLAECMNRAENDLSAQECAAVHSSTMSMLSSLPRDVLLYIIDYLDDKTLSRLCRTSAKFSEFCTPDYNGLWLNRLNKKYNLNIQGLQDSYEKYRNITDLLGGEQRMSGRLSPQISELSTRRGELTRGMTTRIRPSKEYPKNVTNLLRAAALLGYTDIIKYILERSLDGMDLSDAPEMEPLSRVVESMLKYAIDNEHIELVRYLLTYKFVSINKYEDVYIRSALETKNTELVKLIAHDPRYSPHNEISVMSLAARVDPSKNLLRILTGLVTIH